MKRDPDRAPWAEAGAADGRPPRSRAGAVYVEFLIAFLPIFFFFLGLVQLAFVQTANLIVKHSATKAVRAAVVVLPDDPQFYGGVPVGSFTGQRQTDIERAAQIPLATLGLAEAATAKVTLDTAYSRNALLTAKVEYQYHCKVPWGRFVVCGLTNFKTISGQATMTAQGALYEY